MDKPADPLRQRLSEYLDDAVDYTRQWVPISLQTLRDIVAALVNKPAEPCTDPDEAHYKTLLDNDAAILGHPTESAGSVRTLAGVEPRFSLSIIDHGVHIWDESLIYDDACLRVTGNFDSFNQKIDFAREVLALLNRLAETQRSSHTARSDERTISDAAISGLSDTRLETERGAVLTAARQLFDNRLGWGDGRNPYAPRELWADLGAALYGKDDPRVVELRAALSPHTSTTGTERAAVQPPAPEPLTEERARELFNDWYDRQPMPQLLARVDPQQAAHNAFEFGRALTPPSIAQRGAALTDHEIDRAWLMRGDIHDGDLMPQLRDFARAIIALALSPEGKK